MKRILVAILVAAALAGCRRNEMQTESQSTINLAASVADFDQHDPQKPQGSQSKAAAKNPSSIADFAVGQALGLFVHTTPTVGKAAACHSQNIEYATPDGGTTWNQRASLDNDLDPTTTYYATAYSPYVDGQIDPLAMPFSVEKDQTDPIKFEASDLRLTPASPLTGTGTAVSVALDFTHALAMFELKLLIPANVEGKAVDHLETVTFENLATSTSINLATGATTTDLQSVASITPRIISGTGGVAVMTTYRAHVPPQNVDGGVTLAKIRCKMVDGSTETMDYITPSKGWISFRAGVRTSLTLMPTAEAAFVGELPQLMDGKAHTDMELPIFVEAGLRWTVDGAGSDWLTIADKAGGTYGQKLTGTSATGGWQNIYIKVSANESQTAPRTGDLTLRAWRADNSEVPAAVLRLVQNYYTFAAVGGVWNTSAAAASDPVLPFASNQQWTAESDADWLLLATSTTVGSGNPSKKFVHSGALAAGKLFLQVSANTSVAARRGVVTISSPVAGAASIKLYVNQVGNQPYVEIGALRWATGNLVATRSSVDGVSAPGCMIGAPEDGGLYFQFGSLIGWKGGDQKHGGTGVALPDASMHGKWWNKATVWEWKNEAMIWPSAMTTAPATWPKNATTNQWYFGQQSGWSTWGQNIRDYPGLVAGSLSNVGVGDPCTYYLGNPWRLPTTAEQTSITGKGGNPLLLWTTTGLTGRWATANEIFGGVAGPGSWFGPSLNAGSGTPSLSTDLFLPASGLRNASYAEGVPDGGFRDPTTNNVCWSSTVGGSTNSLSLIAYERSGVYPQHHDNVRHYSYPARCVQPAPTVPNPPTADDYVEIDMGGNKKLKWAKGNLVAINEYNAKVGKPADGGLYFQFGSLVGWTGGASGNGVGVTNTSLSVDKAVWPLAMGTTKPSFAWPANYGSAVGDRPTVVDQYFFNYNVAPYSTTSQDIRGFDKEFTGDAGSGNLGTGRYAKWGVGDPCTYYLGAPWRLPTTNEYVAMCNNKSGINSNYSWVDAGGTWVPGSGGNLQGTKLFFPASGVRNPSNGSFGRVTTYGYYWSSSVDNATHGLDLAFDSSRVCPQDNYHRSYGFPVRCVAD